MLFMNHSGQEQSSIPKVGRYSVVIDNKTWLRENDRYQTVRKVRESRL